MSKKSKKKKNERFNEIFKQTDEKKSKKNTHRNEDDSYNLNDGKIYQYSLASKIIEKEYIIKNNNELYKFNNDIGAYNKILDSELGQLVIKNIDNISKKNITFNIIKSVIGLVKYLAKDINISDGKKNKHLLNCLNCVLEVEELNKLKHERQYGFFSVLNVNYDKTLGKMEFKESKFNKFLNDMTGEDKELRRLLQEIAGYCMSNLNNAKKFFVLYGKPHCGKSVFLDLLTDIIGEKNISNIELQDLRDKRYVGRLRNKIVNICNELPSTSIKGTTAIKSLVSDLDSVSYKDLYKEVGSFKNNAKLIFACNTLPDVENKTNKNNQAFFERIIILPFYNSVPIKKQNKNLINELKEEKELIFFWMIKGLRRYIKNNYSFSYCEQSEKYLNRYIQQQSIVNRFINEYIEFEEGEYEFQSSIIIKLREYFDKEGYKFNKLLEKEKLKTVLVEKYCIEYSKIHRDGENKYGYKGIKLKNN